MIRVFFYYSNLCSKHTRNENVYNFSVDYNDFNKSEILNTHKYLIM